MIAHINGENNIQTVEEHCMNTAEYAACSGRSVGLENTMRLAGILHDTGKNTEAFKDYIERSHRSEMVERGSINHSSSGGKYLLESIKEKGTYEKLTKELIAFAVFSHHGLDNMLSEEGTDRFGERQFPKKSKRKFDYEESIDNSKDFLCDIEKLFGSAAGEVAAIFKKVTATANKMNRNNSTCETWFLAGCLQRLILSMLIDADRRDTAEFMSGTKFDIPTLEERTAYFRVCLDRLETRLDEFQCDTPIEKLRREMSSQCARFALENGIGIYRLSIPTGGGKTFSSMRYALILAERLKKERIIYTAPFLSILEQNAAELRTVFGDSDYILEHHSNVFADDGISDGELNKHELLADDWSSPIILTTMVRFLNVLFGKGSSDIRRMHRLKNSIIIIDEAQAVPVKYIHLFNTMLNFLSGVCGTTIVMCTATQPLFEKTERPLLYSENSNIIPDMEMYSSRFKRADIDTKYVNEIVDTERFAKIIEEITNESCLIILNTKQAVRKLYDTLTVTANGFEIVQLTTFMCAQHRLDVIREMKEKLKAHKKIICVSTQLIEAGVDISFETVVRSLAGLDSVAQAAGRCNRNGESAENGKTYIVRYEEENLSSLTDIKEAQRAMDIILNKKHGDLLMPEAFELYYRQYFFNRKAEMDCFLPKISSDATMYDLLSMNKTGKREYQKNEQKKYNRFMHQAYKTAASAFSPIDDIGSIGVIVYYGESKELINRLYDEEDFEERKKLLRKLQRYTVNMNRESRQFRELSEMFAFETELFEGDLLILTESYYSESGIITGLTNNIF